MAYSYDRRASQAVIMRPEGWRASGDEVLALTRGGHLYRGVTEEEWRFIESHGVIRSNERYSIRGEGTNFAADAADAESYVNSGRDDPRKTGKASYLIEVKKTDIFTRWRDGYWKTPEVPKGLITRVWKMVGENDAVVGYPVH